MTMTMFDHWNEETWNGGEMQSMDGWFGGTED